METTHKQIVLGILAHVDSGKTTLSEAMLYRSGAIRKLGRVDHKDAFLDTDTLEKARGITIFSKQAMARFAKTGRQSDHFFAMRPFTREERVAVLTHLKAQNEQNPYFSIYFFKPEYHQPRTEICLYEGKGTMLTKADTDYDFSGMHAEALITQPEFSRKYKEFFLKDLLESKVLSPKETLAAFDELIEIAKDA